MAKVIKNIQLPYPQAFDRLYHTIINGGFRITQADIQTGFIRFDSGVCMSDWGFNFLAQVGALNQAETQIYFTGRPKFGLDLFGAGNRKIERMMKNY